MNDEDDNIARLRTGGIVAIASGMDPGSAMKVADALVEGGIACLEITLRSEGALRALEICAARGDLMLGAGTVRTVAQAQAAVDAGADFLVSPGISTLLLEHCRQRRVWYIPGIATPTELMLAWEHGAAVVKFFPAATMGGPSALMELAGPFPDVSFIPTGGVTSRTAESYLRVPSVVAVGGSWLVDLRLVEHQSWGAIRDVAREAHDLATSVLAESERRPRRGQQAAVGRRE